MNNKIPSSIGIIVIIIISITTGVFIWKYEKSQPAEIINIETIIKEKQIVASEKQNKNELKEYINNDAKIKITYNPDYVGIKSVYLPNLPEESNYGPCVFYGKIERYGFKDLIENYKVGERCTATAECGSNKAMRESSFCEIQQNGDSKGKMEIIDSPTDAEWVVMRYVFYENDYEITIWPYNYKCGADYQPCDNIKRWDGQSESEFIDIETIIDAYKNNQNLTVTLFNFKNSVNETYDLRQVFNEFKEAISSIENI